MADAAYEAGAVIGNDISGFADPDYLPRRRRGRRDSGRDPHPVRPRIPDPEPHYDDVVAAVSRVPGRLAPAGPRRPAWRPNRIVLDAGLDLGKTWQQSLELLRRSNQLAALGYPLLLSASNKTFLGRLLDLEIDQRRDASLAATAVGVAGGCRIVRTHDVRGTRRVCDVLAAVLEAA